MESVENLCKMCIREEPPGRIVLPGECKMQNEK